jgi:hypothetical protein
VSISPIISARAKSADYCYQLIEQSTQIVHNGADFPAGSINALR